MDLELTPSTEAGRRFVALAEEHARDFANRAERHDREGSFPVENIDAMRRSGASSATVPVELGGLGVDSIHDYVAGVNRLGRGDGSTALAANMHIFRTWFITRAWTAAPVAGRDEEAVRWASLLRRIASGEVIVAARRRPPPDGPRPRVDEEPFSPNEALEYIGKVALGLDPAIDGWSDAGPDGGVGPSPASPLP